MFNTEFYPTPRHVLDQMGIDCYGKVVLEPSAGKGDIVDYCKEWGATEVLACELNEDLRTIVSRKATLIGNDFFKVTTEDVSHIQCIVMNPPFSNADQHILHAWNIAPEGCEIIALCNYETICKSHYGSYRRELASLVDDYGESFNMGDVFSQAERKTDVNIGMIKLFKPMVTRNEFLDEFYLTSDENVEMNAVVGYNEIKAIVNTYVAAVKCFEEVEKIAGLLKSYTNVNIIGSDDKVHGLSYGDGIRFSAGYNEKEITTKQQFARGFQKKCWGFIFYRVGIEKYLTKGVMEDINKFITNRKNYPFTVKNISKMLDIIVGTRGDIMNRAIVEALDNFTRHTDENRFGVEGWKTNSGHLLNKKFIINYMYSSYYGHIERNGNILDLCKAICFLTGTNYDEIPEMPYRPTTGQWYDWGFFEFKVYKKGTGHFKFKDTNVWATLNRAYAKIKGQVLPEKL